MSIKVMTAVWSSKLYSSGTLLVLLAMADYCNDDDWTCRPAVSSLAQKARLSDRQVHRILRDMESDGVITNVGDYPSRRGSPITIYRINATVLAGKHDNMSPFPSKKRVTSATEKGDIRDMESMTSATQKGDICDTERVTPMSYDPSVDPSLEPSVDPSNDDDCAREKTASSSSSDELQQTEDLAVDAESDAEIIEDPDPIPPVANAPLTQPAGIDPAQLEAAVEALLDYGICADYDQADIDAPQLLAEFPAEWVIWAASQTASKKGVTNPSAYMRKILVNWQKEKGPRPRVGRENGRFDSEALRRARYIPAEFADIIIG